MINLATPAERLRAARESAGYTTARAFWQSHGLAQATYQNHETGSRKISADQAARYAKLLNISAGWLLTGEGDGPLVLESNPTGQRTTTIAEVDVRAEAGAGGSDLYPGLSTTAVEEWQVPTSMLDAHVVANKGELRIIRVHGDSMQPLLRPGDRILVDLSDRLPSPPGIFVLWDGIGIVIKRVEFIAYSDPKVVRLVSVNVAYQTYERPLEGVVINGRVVGRWDWT